MRIIPLFLACVASCAIVVDARAQAPDPASGAPASSRAGLGRSQALDAAWQAAMSAAMPRPSMTSPPGDARRPLAQGRAPAVTSSVPAPLDCRMPVVVGDDRLDPAMPVPASTATAYKLRMMATPACR